MDVVKEEDNSECAYGNDNSVIDDVTSLEEQSEQYVLWNDEGDHDNLER
jgi:hypothetical protein